MKRHQHAIYGLYLPDHPDVILYAGSWRVATLDERLRQHRNGECKTTAKMAARGGVDLAALRMRVLAYWMSGVDPNPENEVTLGLQAQGWCRWNRPYAFSSEDGRRGLRVANARMTPEERSKNGRKGGLIGGRISMKKVNETWGKTPEAHEARSRAGRIGGLIGGRIGGFKGSHDDKVRAGRIGARNQPREARVRGGRTTLSKRSPENRVAYARIGGRKTAENGWHKTAEAHEAHVRGGRISGPGNARKMNETWGKTPEAQEARSRAGRIGMSKMSREDHARGGRLANCARWHPDRPKVDRLCAECAAKGAQTVSVPLA